MDKKRVVETKPDHGWLRPTVLIAASVVAITSTTDSVCGTPASVHVTLLTHYSTVSMNRSIQRSLIIIIIMLLIILIIIMIVMMIYYYCYYRPYDDDDEGDGK